MNKTLKRLISALLVILMILPTASVAFATEEVTDVLTEIDEEYVEVVGEIYPIVYVLGKVDTLYKDKDDPSSETIYPPSMDNVELGEMADNILSPLKKALEAEMADDQPTADEHWADYGDALYQEISNIFKDLRLGNDGEPTDNSGIHWEWPEEPLFDTKKGNRYGIYDYTFHYDWRLDMYHNAEILDQYINEVLEVTGAEKCVLISRCYGCNLVTAYLQSYGYDAVDNCILYCSTAEGSIVCSEIFSGEVELNADGLDAYLTDLFGGTNPIKSLIGENADALLGLGIEWSVNKILEKVGNDVIPKTLMETFGTMPGYWSMVDDAHFELAKEYAFPTEADERKFYKLIDKIDFYHYTTQVNVDSIIMDGFEQGMRYANITKYGSQLVPVIQNLDFIGDSIVEVEKASLGATATRVNETFSDEYIANASFGGYYISPEKQIDAATALIPDCTWFVKGVDHFSFPESVDQLLLAIARYDGQMTIFSYSNFPQYLEYESDENVLDYFGEKLQDSNSEFSQNVQRIMNFINIIIKVITALFGVFI